MRFGSRDSSEFWRPFVSTSFPGNKVTVVSGESPTQKSQWWIQGRGPGASSPLLFVDQTETRRAEKSFLETGPPYLRVWMTALPPSPPPHPSGSATDKHMGSLTKQWLLDGQTVFRPYPRRLESLNLYKGSTFSLRYGKTGNKQRASCFATLLKIELNSHHGCAFYHSS